MGFLQTGRYFPAENWIFPVFFPVIAETASRETASTTTHNTVSSPSGIFLQSRREIAAVRAVSAGGQVSSRGD
jgi:hypothetical protein